MQSFRNVLQSGIVKDGFTTLWHSGEPLVVGVEFYRDILDSVNSLNTAGYNIKFMFQTNGTLIDESWCRFIKGYPQVRIGVSIDGPEFLHDSNRVGRNGKGSFSATYRGIKLLQEYGIPFSALPVITDLTLNHPEEFVHFFSSNDITTLCLNFEEVKGVNQSSSLDYAPAANRFYDFISAVYRLTKGTPIKVREFKRINSLLRTPAAVNKNKLAFPFAMISVDIHGNFSTFSPELLEDSSTTYGNFHLGNVHHDMIASLVDSPKYQSIQRDIIAGIAKCKEKCDYYLLCGGGSPVNKLHENGTFDSAETISCNFRIKQVANVIISDSITGSPRSPES